MDAETKIKSFDCHHTSDTPKDYLRTFGGAVFEV